MADTKEIYEKLRQLLSPELEGFHPLPKHELTDKLLQNIYPLEEAEFLAACLEKPWEKVSLKKAAELSGKPLEEVQAMWMDMMMKGKIGYSGEEELFIPAYLPGVFESYFTFEKDDPERMKKAAEAHVEILKMAAAQLASIGSSDFNHEAGWRFVPAVDPIQKTIEINQTIEAERQILPFEVLGEYLNKYDVFAVTQCSCRTAAKLAGEPCKRTAENFCMTAGPGAEMMVQAGVGEKLNYDEMMDLLERAAKAGLVHSTQNMQEPATFICNCCSCCCGVLKLMKDSKFRGSAANTNFTPIIDSDKCTLCETCADMCPMEVIALKEASSGDMMAIDLEYCIGCGVCAANCPEEAITLKKTRDNMPHETLPSFFGE